MLSVRPTIVGPLVLLGVVACIVAWICLQPQVGGRVGRGANMTCSIKLHAGTAVMRGSRSWTSTLGQVMPYRMLVFKA